LVQNNMTIVPSELPERVYRGNRPSAFRDVLDKFVSSGFRTARVDGYGAKPNSAATSFRSTISRWNYPVKVSVFNGQVYLILA